MKSVLVFGCLIGLCLASPYPRQGLLFPRPDNLDEGIPAIAGFQNEGERQAILGALGTAIAPIVGAVVGPLLTNFANGLATILTGNRPSSSSSNSSSRPTFDAYMIQVPGAEGPYLLLTQESAETSIDGQQRRPINLPFHSTSVGKVHLKPQPIQPSIHEIEKSQETEPSHDRGDHSQSEEETAQ